MKRSTSRRAIFHKERTRTHKRDIAPANRPIGKGSLYEEIKSRGGVARVCVVRSVGGIGDVLMTTPALMQLKREFPELHLTYAVDRHRATTDPYYWLLYNAHFIDEIIDARYVDRSQYHAVTDISSVCIRYERKGLPAINRIDLFARALGITRLRNKIPFYQTTQEERAVAKNTLSGWRKAGKRIVVLHTASFEGKRTWHAKNQIEMLELAAQIAPDIQWLVFDFNNHLSRFKEMTNCWDGSRTSVREMAALIEAADLFIGPDSGPMHLAGAVSTKALVLFGSIPPHARINYYPTHDPIVLKKLSCLGCWYEACPIQIKCMSDITGTDVLKKAMEKLNV